MNFEKGRGQEQENENKLVENLQKREEKLVLIDTDGGTDDAWAIFLCLAAHKDAEMPFRVVGITCTYGNTHIDHVTVNVLRILETAKVTDVPVFRGAKHPLHSAFVQREGSRHGVDGFGDANLPPVIRAKIEKDIDGANAIVQMSELYQGSLSFLALAPLTNLALALEIQPEIKRMIQEIYMVGGNQQDDEQLSPLGQFNIQADVDAAKMVMSQFSSCCPIFVTPWETFSQSGFERNLRVEKLGKLETDEITLLNTIERNILNSMSQAGTGAGGHWVCADVVAAAICLEPMIVKIKDGKHWKVDEKSKGLFFLQPELSQTEHCIVIKELDMNLYEKMLLWAVGGHFSYKDD